MHYADYLARAARHYGSRTAIIDGNHTVTYAEWDERARRLAAGLRALGLDAGDRVADIGWNRSESLDLDFATAYASLVRVSINVGLTDDLVNTIIDDCRCRALVVGPGFEGLGRALAEACSSLEFLVGPRDGTPYPLDELTEVGGELDWDPPTEDDILALRYTGGTTGAPKGVVRLHGEQINVASAILLDLYPVTGEERMLHASPLSHGANPYVLPLAMRGASQVLLRRFDASEALRLVAEHSVTSTKIVPPGMLVELIRARHEAPDLDLSSLTRVIYGSAPMPRQLLREAAETFGPVFVETFGQTEFPVGICCLPLELHRRGLERDAGYLGSAGRPYSTADVAIATGDGRLVGPATGPRLAGEVVVRGPLMMSGYWEREDATAAVLCDGWLHTGDVGRFDDDGFLYLLGRATDAIDLDGRVLYPREIEEVLYRHPDVDEALAFDLGGARIGAAVVTSSKSTTEDELLEHCRGILAEWKCPTHVGFLERLPRSSAGKVLRRCARDEILHQVGDAQPRAAG